MITFHSVKYKNLLASGNVWTEMSLDTHKNTLIIGVNGGGKSTFLDAICFCLFDKPYREIVKNGIINSINKKNCLAELEFTTNGKRYKVIRGRAGNVFEIYCNGTLINQDAKSRDYQNYLEEQILRFNYKTFTQVVILGSASFTPFMDLSAANRRTVIESLLDIQIFSVMSAIVKQQRTVNESLLEKTSLELAGKLYSKSNLEKTITILKQDNEEKIKQLETKKNDTAWLETDNETSAIVLELEVKHLLEKTIKNTEYSTKKDKLLSYKAKMESKIHRVYDEMKFFHNNETCPSCHQSIGQDIKEQRIKELVKEKDFYSTNLNTLVEKLTSTEYELVTIQGVLKEINDLQNRISDHRTKYKMYKQAYEDLDKEIKLLTNQDKPTDSCQQQLEEIIKDITILEEEKKTLLEEKELIDQGIILLKDGGIKSRVIKTYLPIINKQINIFLSKLGFFVDFSINEAFEEKIKSRHRDEFQYNNFSEGEKRRIDLSILLAWRHIAKLKNSLSTNLLIFDEILDSSLDGYGIEEFMKIMSEMEKSNIFVISHRGEMPDKFDRVLEFQKVKNFSVMKES